MNEVRLAPTVTRLPDDVAGRVLVTGSHGGAYVGYLAARARVRALVAHDAGVGLDDAGVASLLYLEALGTAAVAVTHTSARIGDAEDMLDRGVLGAVNRYAAELGCTPGMGCTEAVDRLAAAPLAERVPEPYAEARHLLGRNGYGLRIVCVDSVSLVEPGDAGQVVLSGSHGGVVSGQAALAIKVAAAGAFYNDAGIGIDDAGVGRLPLLDERGIVAATVDAMSARIGDARSTYRDGRISRVNAVGERAGLRIGMLARDAVERVRAGPVTGP